MASKKRKKSGIDNPTWESDIKTRHEKSDQNPTSSLERGDDGTNDMKNLTEKVHLNWTRTFI